MSNPCIDNSNNASLIARSAANLIMKIIPRKVKITGNMGYSKIEPDVKICRHDSYNNIPSSFTVEFKAPVTVWWTDVQYSRRSLLPVFYSTEYSRRVFLDSRHYADSINNYQIHLFSEKYSALFESLEHSSLEGSKRREPGTYFSASMEYWRFALMQALFTAGESGSQEKSISISIQPPFAAGCLYSIKKSIQTSTRDLFMAAYLGSQEKSIRTFLGTGRPGHL